MSAEQSEKHARTFVLVHGAWHGGWCWAGVAKALEQRGHRCFAPTLRGLAHREGLLTRELSADSHVDDVANLIESLDLQNVVLALHSYAGLLGPALLARLGGRIVHTAWIEAVIPATGQRMLDLALPEAAARYLRSAEEAGDGWLIPPPDVAQFNLPAAITLAQPLTPQPLRTFSEPVRAPQVDAFRCSGSYLLASDRDPQPYRRYAEQARHAGWPVVDVPGGHLLMLTNETAVVDFLAVDVPGKIQARTARPVSRSA